MLQKFQVSVHICLLSWYNVLFCSLECFEHDNQKRNWKMKINYYTVNLMEVINLQLVPQCGNELHSTLLQKGVF